MNSIAMRDAFLRKIHKEMHYDQKIFFVSADFGSPVLDDIRNKFLDTSGRNPLNNQKLSSATSSNPRIRVIHEVIGVLLYKLVSGKKLGFYPIDKDFNKKKEIKKKKNTLEFKSRKKELLKKDEKLNNALWFINFNENKKIPDNITFNMVLNLASVCNAESSDILWEFIYNYYPEMKNEKNDWIDELLKYGVHFFKEFIFFPI